MMSDFLARLAQRSMGAAPLIAPRLPSLFAPVDESPTGNVADTTVTDSARISPLAAPPFQSYTTARTDPDSREPRASVYPPQRLPAPEVALKQAPAARIDSTPPHVGSPLIPLVETAQAKTQGTTSLRVTTVASHSAASWQPSVVPHKQAMPAAAAEPWLPLLPQRRAESAAPRLAWPDSDMGADTGASPPPTVHITIGRVEVKANIAAPSAAPRPRTASKPTLSLGDYLKRGGGAS